MYKSPRGTDNLKKSDKVDVNKRSQESLLMLNNIITYVKETSKNVSQRPATIKGKENVQTVKK